uniref:Leucine rich repeats and IQ motif containing 1 n=2 Tax=Podarcis muralis TaxID=64176 RepID=A0A670KC38_PODMU|nr:leucine-rich repeat and IQ domain-containing protein 1 isoform X1 [Podarcis muralis]XP_028602341.1 leucine-rich repeat and IQ domain-containing protein 1 isoform X1 [Podarcis muralis]XP_028602342.1 leucine-rich repeat and IQ domain-containing protein 1 isoform X1 [Podarcis muralis]
MEEDYDDRQIEEEIELELSKISFSSSEIDDPNLDPDLSAEASSDSEPISDELPESVIHYLNFVKRSSHNAEKLILQDLENDEISSDIYKVVPNNASECLAELASEYNEDPEELKKRVLSEIEDEDEEQQQINVTSDNTIEANDNGDIASSEIADRSSLTDDGDTDLSFTFQEVEERCKREYELWEEKQNELENERIKQLKIKKCMEETQNEEEEKRRQLRQEELEAERMKLEMFQAQQQTMMEKELMKEEKSWKEQMRQHEELINNLQIQIEEEKKAFEEQQAMERQHLAELQNMAAVKIQATFRAFLVYKKYSPVLKERKKELEKQRELQEAMQRERKEKQERLMKRALEKKEQEEKERKRWEEKERQELEEKMKRHEEYEKKKEILRLQREQLILEELKMIEKGHLEFVIEKKMESENVDKEKLLAKNRKIIKEVKEGDETEKSERQMKLDNIDKVTKITKKLKAKEQVEERKEEETAKIKRGMGPPNTEKALEIANKEEEIKKVKEEEEEQVEERKEEETGKIKRGMGPPNTEKTLEIANKEEEIKKVKEEEEEQVEERKEEETGKIKRGMGPPNTEKTLEIANKEEEIKKVKEQEEAKYGRMKLIEEKQQKVETQEKEYEKKKQDEIHEMMHVGNDDRYRFLTTVEFQGNGNTNALNSETITIVNQEDSRHSSCISMDVQLDSGGAGQIDGSYASENIKIELALKEIHEEVTSRWARCENSVNSFEQPLVLSDSIEKKRLAWMKGCKSWSRIYREHQGKKIVERSRPWKCSSGLMPPLCAAMIMQAGPWNSLQQVTTVTFQDLPGCSLSTLSQCSKLQFLSLRRCGLLSLEGLSNCKDLKYIDAEENNIKGINCENLENLCILILNKNDISSLHGLYGCTNLWNLELSYNKITRIGGLESLKNLQRLVIDHNQLISTKGLSHTPTLVYIDCSFNHLTHIDGIENCGLLQILKLQGNNFNEFPSLENHVLLRELYLEDNSISTMEKLSTYWLPLLQILFISQNSLTQLAPLFSCVSLEKLDISNNCLLDLNSVIQWLGGCDSLRELSLQGNPLLQEENWRHSLLKVLPSLNVLNDENIKSDAENADERMMKKAQPGSFAAFCQAQIQKIDLVSKKATTRLIEFSADAVQLQCWYLKKLMKLSSEHRYAHEYGVLNATEGEEPVKRTDPLNQEAINITEQNNFSISGVKQNKQDSFIMAERRSAPGHTQAMSVNSFVTVSGMGKNGEHRQEDIIQYSLNHNEESKDNVLISLQRNTFSKQMMESNEGNSLQHFDSSQNLAATVIQSHWRSYCARKKINFYTWQHLAATVIQSYWRSYYTRKRIVNLKKEDHHDSTVKHEAATKLQALWKGFRLRKKLASALAAVKTDEADDDYSEIDVDGFMFDEAVIEKEWPALDSTRFLSQTLLFSDQLPSPKYNEPTGCGDNSHHLKWLPHKTRQLKERPKSFLSESSQISNRSEKSTLSQLSDLKLPQRSSQRSEKEEKISEEWGFKDISTAQLMLKRAHKMKAKKSNKLDPAVRLALFKNNENKHPPVKPPKKAQTAKTGYFEGKEEAFAYGSADKMERNKERTYQWLHTQVWDFEATSPRNEKCKHFLPEIDPEVIKGGRVQHVTSPVRREDTDLELVSMTSGSTLTQNKEKNNQPHRHSAGPSKKDAPVPERSPLGPSHKERISFRDHPVQLSGGWGSGKKKAKALK